MAKVNRVEVEIVANDEASPKIDRLEKRIDGLESDEARIIVVAETERFEKQLQGARRLAETLSGDELTVQMRVVGNLERDLEDAQALFRQLDGQTGTVTLNADTTNATRQLDNLTRSAGSSKSVLANMVGNTTQDVAALGGVAGSAGVAIGQMGEYMADARAEGEQFGTILRNFAVVAGPIAAISVGLAAINSVMSAMSKGQAAEKAFDAEQVKRFTEAIEEGTDAAEAYGDMIEDTGEVLAEVGVKAGPSWTQILPPTKRITEALSFMGKFGDEVRDILPLLTEAGVSSEVWTNVITSSDPERAIRRLRDALREANVPQSEMLDILEAARNAQENYATATQRSADVQEFFAGTLRDTSDAAELIDREIRAAAEGTDLAATNARRFGEDGVANFGAVEEGAEDAADAVSSVKGAFDDLLGVLDKREAWRNAQEAIEDLRDAAIEYYTAVDEGATNAAEKQRDYQEAVDELVRDLVAAGQDPVTIQTVLETLDQGQINEALAISQAKLGAQPPLRIPVALDVADTNLRINEYGDVQSRYTPPRPSLQFQTAAPNITVINPPGTPQSIYEGYAIFESRNGAR